MSTGMSTELSSENTAGRKGVRPWHLAAGAVGLAGLAYGAYALEAWRRYGKPRSDAPASPFLDRHLPRPEVAERHQVRVAAPVEVTYAAACEIDLMRSPWVNALVTARARLMGASGKPAALPGKLLDQVRDLGWGLLDETPGREIVFGAITQPWRGDVVFRALPPGVFEEFQEPGFVKIVWNIAVEDAGDPDLSIFRTETRVATTDASARARFRSYWAFAAPGIRVIRHVVLRLVKQDAERRATGR
jgi:hypothetical protein